MAGNFRGFCGWPEICDLGIILYSFCAVSQRFFIFGVRKFSAIPVDSISYCQQRSRKEVSSIYAVPITALPCLEYETVERLTLCPNIVSSTSSVFFRILSTSYVFAATCVLGFGLGFIIMIHRSLI